jgi:hypothetical protein
LHQAIDYGYIDRNPARGRKLREPMCPFVMGQAGTQI